MLLSCEKLESDGFCIVPGILGADYCDSIIAELEAQPTQRPGIRSLLSEPWCREVIDYALLNNDLKELIPAAAIAVQCALFDKSTTKNWLVAWHQDLAIPVRERTHDPRCSGWSKKDGVWYVQPPVEVLASLVVVRLQLDEPVETNGALKVVPQSHSCGRLTAESIQRMRGEFGETICSIPRGGALVMRPLLLHASSKLTVGRRRVLHILLGSPHLPCGLRWNSC